MYTAVIGDIIKSRLIENRNEVQKKLKSLFEIINDKYNNDIAAKFVLTLGDEFQGLLLPTNNLFKIIDLIQFEMYPIRIRFGVGFGDIYTEINKEMALGADGPAYHKARQAIEYIKAVEKGKQSVSSNIILKSSNNEFNELLDLVNSNLHLCSFIEKKWTDKQRLLISEMILEGKNQTKASVDLHIAQSSVQRRLNAAGYYDFINARKVVVEVLKSL